MLLILLTENTTVELMSEVVKTAAFFAVIFTPARSILLLEIESPTSAVKKPPVIVTIESIALKAVLSELIEIFSISIHEFLILILFALTFFIMYIAAIV